jgi:T-complex protein 1 subunit gamma
VCDTIIALKPDVVITEKGLSDLAAHFFTKVGVGEGRETHGRE